MISTPARHVWAIAAADASSEAEIPLPEPRIVVRCHRRLRGPYTGGGALLRTVVPELHERAPELVTARAAEIAALAPELADFGLLPLPTLTNTAAPKERTRFYPATRTLRLAHSIAELLMGWARVMHPGGVTIAFRGLDDADPTDRDLVAVLLRRCDPGLLTVIAETEGVTDDALGRALAAYARGAARPPRTEAQPPVGADLAQLFIDSDGTSREPALVHAYAALAPQERARRHTARAEHLAALGEPRLRLGAIPYHLENGTDPAAGSKALVDAVNESFALGFYESVIDLALRGRRLTGGAQPSQQYWNLTHKIGACLSYLGRGEEALGYLHEIRRGTADPDTHMNADYQLAMLYTRFLRKELHDEDAALGWVNTAIALADQHPDTGRRPLVRAFMRNARALVDLHRGAVDGALALVNEAMAITDTEFGPEEQLLHRSVLLYNRAQVLGALGDHAGSLRDYDEVIARDPDYGDYYFERAAQHRALGRDATALVDYATAIRLSPPFYEAHFNRADLLRELGEDDAALQDLDYAIEIEPAHVDSLVHRADLLLARGEVDRVRADINRGLTLAPRNAQLLAAQAALLGESDDAEAAYAGYGAALREDPGFVAAWANRAVLAYSTGRLTQAVDDLDQAIKLADDPALRANRAIVLQELGDHHRAVEDLDIAVAALAEADPDLLYRRGASRFAIEDTDGALSDWQAHLAAFESDESSPYAEQIRLTAGKLMAVAEVREPSA